MMCKLYIRASSIGNPVILSKEEMAAVKKKFETYGQVKDNNIVKWWDVNSKTSASSRIICVCMDNSADFWIMTVKNTV